MQKEQQLIKENSSTRKTVLLLAWPAILEQIMQTILTHFHLGDLTPEENALWHQIDDEMLSQELKNLMNGEHEMIPVPLTSEPDFRERPHEEVEEEFYKLAESLVQKMQA